MEGQTDILTDEWTLTELQLRGGIEVNSEIIDCFSMKIYVVTLH